MVASDGLRTNRVSLWTQPIGTHFQHNWMVELAGKNINWLELRTARYALLQLASPGDMVQLHGNHIHKKDGGHPLLISVQGEPSFVVPSH